MYRHNVSFMIASVELTFNLKKVIEPMYDEFKRNQRHLTAWIYNGFAVFGVDSYNKTGEFERIKIQIPGADPGGGGGGVVTTVTSPPPHTHTHSFRTDQQPPPPQTLQPAAPTVSYKFGAVHSSIRS